MTATHPLRLAVGSHRAGSGKGCAMNVISWENGDTAITDMPACADPFLARIVQGVNDTICTHRDGDLLCPECSIKVLDLAHRTVGTGRDAASSTRVRVWVALACEKAESVLPIFEARFPDDDRPRKAIKAARTAANANTNANAANAANANTNAAAAAANAAHAANAWAAAADAARAAAAAAHAAHAAHAANANTNAAAADAARAAADADADADAANQLTGAHHIITRFYALTGLDEHATPTETTEHAINQMLTRI
jgi:hypothetical protein